MEKKGKVVSFGLPIYRKVFLLNVVPNPMVLHVYIFGAALFNLVVGEVRGD